MPPQVIFPALAVIALTGFVVGAAVGRFYVGTIAAVAGWSLFILVNRQRKVGRTRR